LLHLPFLSHNEGKFRRYRLCCSAQILDTYTLLLFLFFACFFSGTATALVGEPPQKSQSGITIPCHVPPTSRDKHFHPWSGKRIIGLCSGTRHRPNETLEPAVAIPWCLHFDEPEFLIWNESPSIPGEL
jgi:hypothetical protein